MRRAGYFSGVACFVALLSSAHAAEVRYLGLLTVTSTQHCLVRYVGETFSSSFRPAAVGSNPGFTSLSMLNEYSGDIYETRSAPLQPSVWTDVDDHGFTNIDYTFATKLFLAAQDPATITRDTDFVVLTGRIQKMGGDPGDGGTCVAAFRGSYVRRVN